MRKTRVLAAVTLSAFSTMIACDDATDLDNFEWAASLSPANEVVAVPLVGASTATGTAAMSLVNGILTVTVFVDSSLTSGVTGAHIHGPATTTENGPIVFDFTPTMTDVIAAGATAGTLVSAAFDLLAIPVTTDGVLRVSPVTLINMMNAGLAYVNVHSVDNPDGETRGQLVPF